MAHRERLRTALLSLLLLPAALLPAHAQQRPCPSGESYERARGVVEDLQRIVTPNGVQDTYAARIGGIDQWLQVRGKDRANPMILFVHGGPSSPAMPSAWQWQRPVEEYFTIAHYDQRGAGKTYRANPPEQVAGTMTIDRFADDAIEVAEHLRARYDQDKLVLVAHSWGTLVAMKAALRRPDLFHAYVGIGQAINIRLNEELGFQYGLERARAEGNAEAIAELESIAPYPGNEPLTRDRIVAARKWPQHYGGLNAFRNAEQDYYYGASLLSPDYDCEDRRAFFAGNVFTLEHVLDEFLQFDFSAVREFPIPVVMFLGRHDYTAPSAPIADWLDRVQAPRKHGVWFEHSAHMIPWEEPGKTLQALLEHVRPLAVGDLEAESAQPAAGRR